MTSPPRHSLMRNLGAFFGHIIKGARTDVSVQRREVRRQVEEETRPTKDGTLTIRRTTIEEVEVRPPDASAHSGSSADSSSPPSSPAP